MELTGTDVEAMGVEHTSHALPTADENFLYRHKNSKDIAIDVSKFLVSNSTIVVTIIAKSAQTAHRHDPIIPLVNRSGIPAVKMEVLADFFKNAYNALEVLRVL